MYISIILIFTCLGRVNFHCPLNECLSNINKYITVFTSILIYSDTGRKLSHGEENKISQQGEFMRSGTKAAGGCLSLDGGEGEGWGES